VDADAGLTHMLILADPSPNLAHSITHKYWRDGQELHCQREKLEGLVDLVRFWTIPWQQRDVPCHCQVKCHVATH
jgi:hypothetical protein